MRFNSNKNIWQYQTESNHASFKCSVKGSISLENAGPTAKIVLLPALICVCPASSTK